MQGETYCKGISAENVAFWEAANKRLKGRPLGSGTIFGIAMTNTERSRRHRLLKRMRQRWQYFRALSEHDCVEPSSRVADE
jgi:hypothetical protein